MNGKLPDHGVISTVITPFFEDLSIDIESYRREIDLGARSDIIGFLCPCNAMESAFMTEDEKLLMVKEGVDAAAGRLHIISSVMGLDTKSRQEQCEQYLKAGADALCLNIPYTPEMTKDDYMKAVSEMDAFKPKFMLLQDTSVKDSGFPVDWMADAFAQYDSVYGVKIEVQGSEKKYTQMRDATGGKIKIWGGFGNPATIEAYDRGVIGMMPSGLFELYSNVNKLYFEKGREAAKKLFYAFSPILLQLYSGSKLGNYFHKCYFKRNGIFTDIYSRQKFNIDEFQQRICDEMVDLAIELRDSLPAFWD